MNSHTDHNGTKAGIFGGTVLSVLANIHSGDVIRTALLAALGAFVSFFVSFLLKWLVRWVRRQRDVT